MSTLLIHGGRIIDPANSIDEQMDILVKDGKIAKCGKNLSEKTEKIIDAKGLLVTPGLIDLQVHFREPGREDKETLETGSRAAIAGGVTSVVTMPNLTPVADNQTVIEFIISRAKALNLINIFPSGSITKGQEGERLSEMWEMKNSGAIAVTEDGYDVQDEGLLLRAMRYAKTHDILLMSHCECDNLTGCGVMHEGWTSTRLGLAGTPEVAEDMAVLKNILLAEKSGVRLHLLHNSTKNAIEAIRLAKKRGIGNITAEVSVQHFALTDEECIGYNTNAKMYPPLRSEDHVQEVIRGIQDDTIDAFTTDHAPHIEPEKLAPFEDASFGSTGLETSFAVMNTYLVCKNHISLMKGVEKMTSAPANIIRVPKGTLSEGVDADISIFDLEKKWVVDPKTFYSKGKNCVFTGKTLFGKAHTVLIGGEIKMRNEEMVI
ncbi:dihydroorotase [Candidatus Peregrinibacteria bacterium]|nr:MAG: dihydroorotase [Candidatus Peregrinibacteria bacterium]